MISIYRILFSVASLILFISCNTRDNSNTNNEDELQYTVHINISESLLPTDDGSPEYLLGQPVFVFTDKSDNIYVADRMAMNIRVYDSSGTYKRTIGRRGRGPGEFHDINAMLVDSQNNIIVADQLISRITYLSSTGETISTYPIDQTEMLWPRQIRELEENLFLYLYRLPPERDPSANIIHLFDKNIKRIKSLHIPDLEKGSEFLPIFYNLSPGHLWILNEGHIIYVPPIYDGTWYSIELNRSSRYTLEKKGKILFKSYEEISRNNLPENATRIHAREKVLAAIIERQSLGIFSLANSSIVIFYLEYNNNSTLLKADVYSEDGILIGQGARDLQIPARAQSFTIISIPWKGHDDIFYIIDDRDLPEIKTINLSIDKSDNINQ